MKSELKEVTIYTDGAADPNPGPGGYGAVLICGKHRKELSGGFARTTNNRMEILAAIKGLEALKTPCKALQKGHLPSDEGYGAPLPPKAQPPRPPMEPDVLSREKITCEGQPCRKCSTPVVKRTPRRHGRQAGQCYYYEYYLYCPHCCTLYMLEEAKRPYE